MCSQRGFMPRGILTTNPNLVKMTTVYLRALQCFFSTITKTILMMFLKISYVTVTIWNMLRENKLPLFSKTKKF